MKIPEVCKRGSIFGDLKKSEKAKFLKLYNFIKNEIDNIPPPKIEGKKEKYGKDEVIAHNLAYLFLNGFEV